MNIRHLCFAALGATLVSTPAAAQNWRYCMTIVKDGAGAERILLLSPILEVESVPNFNQAWTQFSRPVAEAALRQHGTRGSVAVNCTVGEARSETVSHRSKILSIANRRGILYRDIPWNPAVSPSANRASDNNGTGRDERAGSEPERASADSGPTEPSRPNAPKQPVAPKWIGAPSTSPPTGYSEWKTYARGAQYKGFSIAVRVDYAYRILDDEIRVVWRCTNETNVDLSCSIGAGASKVYQCTRHHQTPLGTTRSLGERATVRAGSTHTFPSDWACRGLKANSFTPSAAISWE